MSVTKQLLDVFRVDKQLRGLKSRLDSAERFLSQQLILLADLEKQRTSLDTQVRQLKAVIANEEGEVARLDVRMATLREQMNSAKTAKEYNAFLAELNTIKEQKGGVEERAMEAMQKCEESDRKLTEVLAIHSERSKLIGSAQTDRDTKAAEIKDRVVELQDERSRLVKIAPAREMAMLEMLIKSRGDEAMAPVEVLDRRAHEGNCSACMMAVPIEAVSALMGGKLVNCPNCRAILFMDDETFKQAPAAVKAPKPPKKTKKAKEAEAAPEEASPA